MHQAANAYGVSFNCLHTCCPVHLSLNEKRNAQTKRKQNERKNRTNIQFVSLLALFLVFWFEKQHKIRSERVKINQKTPLPRRTNCNYYKKTLLTLVECVRAAVGPVPANPLAAVSETLSLLCLSQVFCATRIAIHTHASLEMRQKWAAAAYMDCIKREENEMKHFLLQLKLDAQFFL